MIQMGKSGFIFSLFLALMNLPTMAQQKDALPDWAFSGFERVKQNPVISPDSTTTFFSVIENKNVAWESNDTFNPAAIVKDGKIVVLYRAEDKSGVGIGYRTSRIGYAESTDGVTMKRRPKPVFYPGNDDQKANDWPGGCEDPRVAVAADGTYVMMYTSWNRKVARLSVATSKDLITWKKHGPTFSKAYGGRFKDLFHKSGSVITQLVGDQIQMAKINGKYWMYWGENHVYAATSTNLVDWEPLLNDKGELLELISPRKGYFDSALTECGPPALITDKGILLLYNGKNGVAGIGDPQLNPETYSAGQVLFDLNDPTKVKGRLDKPFFKPEMAYEKAGQYANGTVFIEGLVFYKSKWFLYYGCADSRVAVAISPVSPITR